MLKYSLRLIKIFKSVFPLIRLLCMDYPSLLNCRDGLLSEIRLSFLNS
jgi:hypothetical protein